MLAFRLVMCVNSVKYAMEYAGFDVCIRAECPRERCLSLCTGRLLYTASRSHSTILRSQRIGVPNLPQIGWRYRRSLIG